MSPIIFWFFALLMLAFGLGVVINRNPVAAALSLVVSFLGLAALFVSLDAYFIGIVQILVYAGAVMVLFLFIIMLLDLRAEERRKLNPVGVVGGLLVTIGFISQIVYVISSLPNKDDTIPPLEQRIDDVRAIGINLFSLYNLPLQVVAVLVLVASIGVVVLSKRELK